MITEWDAAELTGRLLDMQSEFLHHAEQDSLLMTVAIFVELNTRLIEYINNSSVNNERVLKTYLKASDSIHETITNVLKKSVSESDGEKIVFEKRDVEEMLKTFETFFDAQCNLINLIHE